MTTRRIPRKTRKPEAAATRWDGMTAEEKRQATAPARAALARKVLDERIDSLVASAPDLTESQKARLAPLLGAGGDVDVVQP